MNLPFLNRVYSLARSDPHAACRVLSDRVNRVVRETIALGVKRSVTIAQPPKACAFRSYSDSSLTILEKRQDHLAREGIKGGELPDLI